MIFSKILNGGKTVVIMKPSLPYSWFDLCFIPKHDGVPEKSGIFLTNGSINYIENEKKHNKSKGLIVIGGMTAFGAAMRESGTANWLAGGIQSAFESPRMVLAGFILLTMFLTQTMSNAAAALVVLPVAMQTADTLNVSGQTYAIAVMLGASSSFVAPFEPACILVSGPGKYRFSDYLKAGLGLTLIMAFLVWFFVPIIWGF